MKSISFIVQMFRSVTFYTLMAALCVWCVACVTQPAFTEPCETDCNDEAVIGSVCAEAEDCHTGSFCNLEHPNGYCQESCGEDASVGDFCGEDESGSCLDAGGELGLICVANCDQGDVSSCGRSDMACRSITGAQGGVCLGLCQRDSECGGGEACDAYGQCQAVAQCNVQTHQGCGRGQSCIVSESGQTFCGDSGPQGRGEPCGRGADCRDGTLCADNTCKPMCSTDDFSACGGVPADCLPVARGSSLGVCI